MLIALVRKRLADSDVVAKSTLDRTLHLLALALGLLGFALGHELVIVVMLANGFLDLANQLVDVALGLVG